MVVSFQAADTINSKMTGLRTAYLEVYALHLVTNTSVTHA